MEFRIRPDILLHPNIPKPLHGISPRTVFGIEWWNSERQKCYKSTLYHCLACGVHKSNAIYHQWLEAHELYEYNYKKGILTFIEIVPLCHCCHNFIHSGRLEILNREGKISTQKYEYILEHGETILKKYKIRRPKLPTSCAPWEEWKMIIYGKEYRGKFKNYDEWYSFYNNQG